MAEDGETFDFTEAKERLRQKADAAKPVEGGASSDGSPVPALRPRARALWEQMQEAGSLQPTLERDYLVKDWLNRGATSVVFGPSNVGKSFLAVDWAFRVSLGLPWNGQRVRPARTLYIAAEGGSSLCNRVAALEGHGEGAPIFTVLSGALTLVGQRADTAPLIEAMRQNAARSEPFGFVVIDTMARVMGGDDENTAPAIAALIQSVDAIRDATGAHVMLIHHSGKDPSKGARGHSSLRAAVDTEIVLSRDDDSGVITALLDKQRDGRTGLRFDFRLRQVVLGHDQDGDPVTSCILEPGGSAEAERAVGASAQAALEALEDCIASKGEVHRKPTYPGTPAVTLADWRTAALAAEGLSTSTDQKARGKAFRRAREALEERHLVCVRDDLVWRVGT